MYARCGISVKGKSCERKIGINFGRWHVNKSNEEAPTRFKHSMRLRIISCIFFFLFQNQSASLSLTHSRSLHRSHFIHGTINEWKGGEKHLKENQNEIELAYKQRKYISMKLWINKRDRWVSVPRCSSENQIHLPIDKCARLDRHAKNVFHFVGFNRNRAVQWYGSSHHLN